MKRPMKLPCCGQAGFTLVELLAVLVILVVLAAVAIPSLTKSSASGAVQNAARMLANTVYNGKMEAISKRGVRVLALGRRTFRLTDNSATPGALLLGNVPTGAVIFNITSEAAEPGTGYSVPATPLDESNQPALCLFATGAVGVGTWASSVWNCVPSPVSIFLQSEDGEWRSRIVIHQATGYVKTYEAW